MSMDLVHGLHIRKNNTNYFIPSVSSANSRGMSYLTFRMQNSLIRFLTSVPSNFSGTTVAYIRRNGNNAPIRTLSTYPSLGFNFRTGTLSITQVQILIGNSFDVYESSFTEPLRIDIEFKPNNSSTYINCKTLTLPPNTEQITDYNSISLPGDTGTLRFNVTGFGRNWATTYTNYNPWNPPSSSMFLNVSMTV